VLEALQGHPEAGALWEKHINKILDDLDLDQLSCVGSFKELSCKISFLSIGEQLQAVLTFWLLSHIILFLFFRRSTAKELVRRLRYRVVTVSVRYEGTNELI
jgi:hypothetical protein